MTKEQLSLFVSINDPEWHWNWNRDNVRLFIPSYLVEEFSKLFDEDYLTECDVKLELCSRGYLRIELAEVCEDHSINLEEIFKKDSWDSDD